MMVLRTEQISPVFPQETEDRTVWNDAPINDRDIRPTWKLVYGFAAICAVLAFLAGYQAARGDKYDYDRTVPRVWEDGSVTWHTNQTSEIPLTGCLIGWPCDDTNR